MADGNAVDRRSMSEASARPVNRLEHLGDWAATVTAHVPLALAILAEAAWVSVLAALVQEYDLRLPVLDVSSLIVFVLAGLVTSRVLGIRLGGRWPAVALALSVLAAFVGVFVAPASRSALGSGGLSGLAAAFGENPGGLVAGLAFLRGIAWGHAGLPLPEDRLTRLLGGGVIVVALAALAGSLVTEPWRSRFLSDALGAGLIFGAAAIVALALTRQAIAAGDLAAAWHRNPTWVVALVMLVASASGVALAASGQVRPAIELIIGVASVPIIVLGLIGGWSRRTFRVFFFLIGGFAVMGALGSVLVRVQQTQQVGSNGVGSRVSPVDAAMAAGVAAIVAITAVIVVILLVRVWMRQFRIDLENPIEERYVDHSDEADQRTRRGFRLPFGRPPADAVGAYRALVADLADRHGVRRETWETPREHAARLRTEPGAGLPLDLLAADYALATFGGVTLSAEENRRALGRWRLLRGRLQAKPEPLAEELGPDLG
jgi:hypothetical protein